MILIVDNYDSFVHNLARYVRQLGFKTIVMRNDDRRLLEPIEEVKAIIISPGPCTPTEAGHSLALIDEYSGVLPILGVCLGHQAIGQSFGGKIVRAIQPMHGRPGQIKHDSSHLFDAIPETFQVGRYHSLVIAPDSVPACLNVTARTVHGEIMAIEHREHLTFGVQFHPESIMTEHGQRMLFNFFRISNLIPDNVNFQPKDMMLTIGAKR